MGKGNRKNRPNQRTTSPHRKPKTIHIARSPNQGTKPYPTHPWITSTMELLRKRRQTMEAKPMTAYLDLGEDTDDLDGGIHDTPWLIELGSEPPESDINTT